MEKIYNASNYCSVSTSVVTIGTFDGVHLGHKKILEKLNQNAIKLNSKSLVMTFFPHPRMVLNDNPNVKLLNTLEEKQSLLEKVNVNVLVIQPFTNEFSQLSAEEFVRDILIKKFQVKKIIIGHDHHFGKNREANINNLIIFGKKYNFEVEQISAQEINEIAVSSTKIRNAILDGNVALANDYLGYSYFFSGEVVKGKQIGRTIGFPTANIHIKEDYKLIPKNGVYIVKSTYRDQAFFGMMNIGTRPTVNGTNQTIEVNFFDFDKDIYNEIITVEILEFIRNEYKFESLDELKIQIQKDKEFALAYFNNTPL